MDLNKYFSSTTGTGIISTADAEGHVNSAIFSRPHVADDGSIAFLMRERLIHHQLQSNPYAAYLFIEEGGRYKGIRLHLKKLREVDDSPIIEEMIGGNPTPEEDKARGPRHLVFFSVENVLPLVSGGVEKIIEHRPVKKEVTCWDNMSFFQELEKNRGIEELKVASKLLAWANSTTNKIEWTESDGTGSFIPVITHKGLPHKIFALHTSGMMELYFYWHQFSPPFDSVEKRLELLQKLNRIEGISIADQNISERPGLAISILTNEKSLNQLLKIYDWLVREITSS
ncbi:MAG: pyridoxamine 5'-phosphate oxidase family protein [Nitrospira sp.]|nr:pyridoxamine 5'-phosphate oxidase family protein [Nitrospira sp.]